MEALKDLQKSIELNNNQAVYRSQLLLDKDLASRSASLGSIYRDLNFQQAALVEGWKSVNTDPTNYSAHRFLADSYSALPRHEIARVSELLQSQLLQPLNLTPIQPQLAETNFLILQGTGPSNPSFNEFNPLFERNRAALLVDGVVGEKSTWGNDLVVSGLYGKGSISLGQFHFETDGFRENNFKEQDIYNAFVQVNPWFHTSFLAEFRSEESEFGDLPLRFDPELFFADDRNKDKSDSLRLGMRHSFSPRSDLITTAIIENTESNFDNDVIGRHFDLDTSGYVVEAQHLWNTEKLNLITGFGYFDADRESTVEFTPVPPIEEDQTVRHTNVYVYSYINTHNNITWTLGGSGDFFDGIKDTDQFNPKLGLTWNPVPSTTLRFAAFRVLNKTVISDQTIEPTQVAGFSQFFRDLEAEESWRYGAAVDQKFGANLLGGLELSQRDITTPFFDMNLEVQDTDWEERFGRMYLYWTPLNWLSMNLEYQYERFERDLEATGEELVHTL